MGRHLPDKSRQNLPPVYSVLNAFTGLATAALMVWKLTVITVISNTVNTENKKGPAVKPVL